MQAGNTVKPLCLFLAILFAACASPLNAGIRTYDGSGIGFSYPDSFRLEEKAEGNLKRVTITEGTSSIGVSLIETEMSDDLENRIIAGYRKKFKKMKLDDIRFSGKQKLGATGAGAFPFRNLQTTVSRVDTSFRCGGSKFRTTLYLFSMEGKGYVLEMTCRAGECSDYPFFRDSFRVEKSAREPLKKFSGFGIGFDYPASYEVFSEKKKSIERVVVKKKGSSLGIIVMKTPFSPELEELMIEQYQNRLGKSGFTDITVSPKTAIGRGTAKPFPFARIDASAAAVTFGFHRMGIAYETLLYMFNRGGKGHTIDITRMRGIPDVFDFMYRSLIVE